jgi:hypothetical protein
VKTLIGSLVLVSLGLVIGWYIGRSQRSPATSQAVEQMVETMESFEGAEAARDVRAISLIGSGGTESAVKLLCGPIANYYRQYVTDAYTNERRSRLLALIEDLMSTNKTVAYEVTNVQKPLRSNLTN